MITKKIIKNYSMLPLLCIHKLLAFNAAPVAPPAAVTFPPLLPLVSNISANGLPNCSKSSDAFVASACGTDAAAAAGWVDAAPNRSTIGWPACAAGGDDRNGFVSAALAPAAPLLVGDDNLD